MNNKKFNPLVAITITLVVLFLVLPMLMGGTAYLQGAHRNHLEDMSYVDFDTHLKNHEIETIYYDKDEEYFYFQLGEQQYRTTNPSYENFKKDVLLEGTNVLDIEDLDNIAVVTKRKVSSSVNGGAIWTFFELVLFIGIFVFTYKTMKGDSDTSFLKNKTFEKSGIGGRDALKENAKLFSDIAGLSEVKKDVGCLVDFLKEPQKYKDAGATLPKGVILYGPPGTGKTLMAKAIAGEAKVPFYHMSGSDFVELYVGMGARRIRSAFKKAKETSPCILFIDEIDAVGGKRNRGEHSEDRKTINALLSEMDGFKPLDNVLVIGATNRLEDLDPALTRAGRFTDKFCVPLPQTAKERKEVIDLYAANKTFAQDVDLDVLAKETIGFSPAQLESLLNESAIISVQDKSAEITRKIIDKAMMKMVLEGHLKEDQTERDKKELELVAWHESGHALVGKLFGKKVTKVTILASTSGAGGVTLTTDEDDIHFYSKTDLIHEVMQLYAGREAEKFISGDKNQFSTGASNDIEKATHIIHDMVTRYGMSEKFGPLNLTTAKLENDAVLEEEKQIALDLSQKTYDLLKQHQDKLKQIAETLLDNETIYEETLTKIVQ